jgi:glutaconyl-CoA/methylmalonyl-CoA decarboxylase subunit gamma
VAHLKLKITANGQPHEVTVEKNGGDYRVTIGNEVYRVVLKDNGVAINGELLPLTVEGALNEGATVTSSGRQLKVMVEPVREMAAVPMESEASHSGKGSESKGQITAPMPGKIISIKVKAGDTVAQNQIVAVLEAMKMENEIQSDVAGTVQSVSIKPGETVEGGQVLLVVQ